MIVKDPHNKYELKVDIERCIVYEKNMGVWLKSDFHRFFYDYSTKILPLLKGKEWFKYVDLRSFKPSDIILEINEFVSWCVTNGLFGGLVIVENDLIAMHMNACAVYSNIKFSPIIFSNIKDADNWLNSHWL